MFEKIWDQHVVRDEPARPTLLYIDRHFVHEVTSPQAFEGLRQAGRQVRRPDLSIATMDHNVPTSINREPLEGISKKQIEVMRENCREFGIPLYDLDSENQGIVHVIGPEQGFTLPGLTIVCGDSHTSTHGAFGALAFGIGTSEVEHVLATQTLPQQKPDTMVVNFHGEMPNGVTAKDLILKLIGTIGVGGGTGHVIEYAGEAIESLSMEGRMTICNMSIECGARAGLVAPDETTYEYLRGKPHAPSGEDFYRAVEEWKQLSSDPDAEFDTEVNIDVSSMEPQVTWGTNPGQVVDVNDRVPEPDQFEDPVQKEGAERALDYMDLQPGTRMTNISVDRVFIGSCTNSRVEDLRKASRVVRDRETHPDVRAMVVPGSQQVKKKAEEEGLDEIFKSAGFEWRKSGCSMCLGMNPDVLEPGERCASTSNRNFEGRQGRGGRTHLMSPEMAAATAVEGHLVDIREWQDS